MRSDRGTPSSPPGLSPGAEAGRPAHTDTIRAAREWLRSWDDDEDARVGGVVKPIQSRLVADLLAALDALQTELDEWMTPFDGSGIEWHESLPSPYTYQAGDFCKLVSAVHEYECRSLAAERALETAREALLAYESAVQQALTVAPNHWQKYRDPFELPSEIRAARRLALAGVPVAAADSEETA